MPSQVLVFRNNTSEPLEAYKQKTLVIAALTWYREHVIEKSPDQDVCYIVVDDNARQKHRVKLPLETIEAYDATEHS